MNDNIILGQVPNSISRYQLNLILREVCHINLPIKAIKEYRGVADTKNVFIDIRGHAIPVIAMRRLKRLGTDILPNVSVMYADSVCGASHGKLGLPNDLLKTYNCPPLNSYPDSVVMSATHWLHYELHLKYPQLHIIDEQYKYAVFIALGMTIAQRVTNIMQKGGFNQKLVRETTDVYRKLHPHIADFELVASHIEKVEKQLEVPSTQYTEADLLVPTPPPEKEAKLKEVWEQSLKIVNEKVQSYIGNLDSEITPEDSPEMINRKKIRQTMKHFSEFLPQMVEYKPTKDISEGPDWISLYIIAEPSLPPGRPIRDFFARHGIDCYALTITRTSNVAKVQIARCHYEKLMQFDGQNPEFPNTDAIGGAPFTEKIYIRHENDKYANKYLEPAFALIRKTKFKQPTHLNVGQVQPRTPQIPRMPNRFSGPVKKTRPMGPRGVYRFNSRW